MSSLKSSANREEPPSSAKHDLAGQFDAQQEQEPVHPEEQPCGNDERQDQQDAPRARSQSGRPAGWTGSPAAWRSPRRQREEAERREGLQRNLAAPAAAHRAEEQAERRPHRAEDGEHRELSADQVALAQGHGEGVARPLARVVKGEGGHDHHAAQDRADEEVPLPRRRLRDEDRREQQQDDRHGLCVVRDVEQVFENQAFHGFCSPFTTNRRMSSIVASSSTCGRYFRPRRLLVRDQHAPLVVLAPAGEDVRLCRSWQVRRAAAQDAAPVEQLVLGLQKRSLPRCRKVMRSAIRSRSVVMCEDIRIECLVLQQKSQNTSSLVPHDGVQAAGRLCPGSGAWAGGRGPRRSAASCASP